MISFIFAMDENRLIGKDNDLLGTFPMISHISKK